MATQGDIDHDHPGQILTYEVIHDKSGTPATVIVRVACKKTDRSHRVVNCFQGGSIRKNPLDDLFVLTLERYLFEKRLDELDGFQDQKLARVRRLQDMASSFRQNSKGSFQDYMKARDIINGIANETLGKKDMPGVYVCD